MIKKNSLHMLIVVDAADHLELYTYSDSSLACGNIRSSEPMLTDDHFHTR